MIPFNRPYLTGEELGKIQEVFEARKLSGDGPMTKRCHTQLERLLGSGKALLTSSCTDALEAAVLVAGIQPGDEVILPSYTFVSTANAFALRGAKLVFCDSLADHPNMDCGQLEALITPRTCAISPVHYGGVACDMGIVGELAKKHDLWVIEDAAQALGATYNGRPLGTVGDLGAFSFHETKNVISGEGGSLHVNDTSLVEAAEIVREKGTNRSSFFRGEVDKYGWVSLGSSFLPSEVTAAILLAQLEAIDDIQAKRLARWQMYEDRLAPLAASGRIGRARLPGYASNIAHLYYITLASLAERTALVDWLKVRGISAVFHYQSLHASRFYAERHDGRPLPHSDRFTDTLLRLPLFADLTADEADKVCDAIHDFFAQH